MVNRVTNVGGLSLKKRRLLGPGGDDNVMDSLQRGE